MCGVCRQCAVDAHRTHRLCNWSVQTPRAGQCVLARPCSAARMSSSGLGQVFGMPWDRILATLLGRRNGWRFLMRGYLGIRDHHSQFISGSTAAQSCGVARTTRRCIVGRSRSVCGRSALGPAPPAQVRGSDGASLAPQPTALMLASLCPLRLASPSALVSSAAGPVSGDNGRHAGLVSGPPSPNLEGCEEGIFRKGRPVAAKVELPLPLDDVGPFGSWLRLSVASGGVQHCQVLATPPSWQVWILAGDRGGGRRCFFSDLVRRWFAHRRTWGEVAALACITRRGHRHSTQRDSSGNLDVQSPWSVFTMSPAGRPVSPGDRNVGTLTVALQA